MHHNGLAMHRKSIVELLIKQRIFIAFMVYEPLLEIKNYIK
jgi:hypothetical protein